MLRCVRLTTFSLCVCPCVAGPGVGKGRQIAATIFNYFCRGKTKVGGGAHHTPCMSLNPASTSSSKSCDTHTASRASRHTASHQAAARYLSLPPSLPPQPDLTDLSWCCTPCPPRPPAPRLPALCPQALWVSVSADLVVDARRDIEALGMLEYDAVRWD